MDEELRDEERPHSPTFPTLSEVGCNRKENRREARGTEDTKWRLLMEQQNRNFMALIEAMKAPSTSKDIRLPEFNPDKDNVDARAWITTADMCIVDPELQGASLMMALSRALKGQASAWLSQVSFHGMTWTIFKDLFTARYESAETSAAFLINLNNGRPKENECLASYAATLMSSIMSKWKNLSVEQIAVSTILAHISQFEPRVQRLSFTENITTRNRLQQELKATSFLKRKSSYPHDHSHDPKRSRSVLDTPTVKCYVCGKVGHKAMQCRSRIGAKSQDVKTKLPIADVTPRKTPAAPVTCFSCSAIGHYAKNCPRRSNKEGSISSVAGPSQEKRVNVCVVNTPGGMLRHAGQTVDITPREAVRRIGDELTVLCRVPYPIDSCRMAVGPTTYRLIPGNLDGGIIYTGQGLKLGECGALIKNINEEFNGNITCILPPQSGSIEVTGTMRLLVARAPGEPHLITPPQAAFREGDGFMAQCVVPNGRPAAKITWFLNDEDLLTGVHQPILTSDPGSDLVTITQNISRSLTMDDDNKMLVCRAEHEALEKPMEARRQLVVHYPPKRVDGTGTITIFGLKVGAEGKLNVTIRANPPPVAEWTIGDQRLVAPQSIHDGSITALEPYLLGNGFYNVTLILTNIAKEDVERTYYLRVSNELGRDEFAVRISTMDEPAGVELDTGAIVGIVVGVLVVLIAIFLVVLAYATDRWCFAGRRRDNTRSSGESSDTESAVGGRERSRIAQLSARVRAVLPKAKDKVQATETQIDTEEKPLSEEKKGVVYAELALSDQTNTEKPIPPATEYAEIVYTDQPKENKE